MERVTLVTAPASEPVTLADAKAWARVDIADDDALITALITAARLACEKELRQSFLATTWLSYADGFPWGGGYYNRVIRQMGEGPSWLPTAGGGTIELPWVPLASVVSIKWLDFAGVLNTVDPTLYRVAPGSPGRIQPVFGKVWPIPAPVVDAVQVTFVAGYDALSTALSLNPPIGVPENILLAIKILVAMYYQGREAPGDIPEGVRAMLAAGDHGSYA